MVWDHAPGVAKVYRYGAQDCFDVRPLRKGVGGVLLLKGNERLLGDVSTCIYILSIYRYMHSK